MKKHTFLIYAMVLFALISCKEPMPQIARFEYSENNVDITYQAIQNFNESKILTSIEKQNYANIFATSSDAPMDIEAAAKKLEQDFNEEYKDCNEYMTVPCTNSIYQECFLIRQNRVICYRTDEHIYTGGAHGSFYTHYHCYDLRTGKCYNFDYLFEGETGLAVRKIVCEKLREQVEEYEGSAMWTPEDLPKFSDAALLDDGVLFLYQPYEIASFAMGIIAVEISDDELLATGAKLPL